MVQQIMSKVIHDSTTIQLFGRTISQIHKIHVTTNDSSSNSELVLPLSHDELSDHSPISSFCSPLELNSPTEHETKSYKESSTKEFTSIQDEDEVSQQTTKDIKSSTSLGLIVNPETPSYETKTSQPNSTKITEQTNMSQDKIVPCPRCKSLDTKFCYFNNYNLKQPRHFCKNCQRYWTSGGHMRSMLVGAGRRKNKVSPPLSSDVSHFRDMSTVLTFGSDSSIMSNIAYYGGYLAQTCGPSNPTLWKHARDGNNDENEMMIPKKLRIDDPNEVAKSCIRSTLGLKNDGGIFKGFVVKGDDKNHVVEVSSSVLQANPAALSRSLVLHEWI